MSHSGCIPLKNSAAKARFWSKVRKSDGCWEWTAFTENGYGMFWLDGRPQRASRVVWRIAKGRIPSGKWVLHKCDNRACVRPAHLYIGTVIENIADMMARGRGRSGNTAATAARGERCSLSKLTEVSVLSIRALSKTGQSQRKIAAQFDVDHSAVGAILRRETWTHI